jgi:hypothetical protein
MYRYKCLGTTSTGRIITAYVTARDRDHAVDLAFDDMGIVCLASVKQASGSRIKGF